MQATPPVGRGRSNTTARAAADNGKARQSDIRELAPDGVANAASEAAVNPGGSAPAPASAEPPPRSISGVRVANYFNKTLVAAYKVVGFSLLSAILVGLFAYVSLNALFFLHRQWVAPAIIAPSDLRVIELRARLAHELWNRQKVEAELAQVGSDLKHARRTIAMEQQYQSTFQTALQKNASAQLSRVADVRALKQELHAVRGQLESATADFSRTQAASMDSAYQANLIDRHQKAAAEFQLAELTGRRLQLQQQEAQLSQQLGELSQQARALGSVAQAPAISTPATFEGLQLKRSFLNSQLQAEHAEYDVEALQASQAALSKALEGYDQVVSIIRESPLLLAAEGELTLAFAPYENLDDISKGDPVFACAAQIVWCHQVGRVGERIEGEVTAKHPVYGRELRGGFVRLELDSARPAHDSVLHVGRPPLFL